jgi:hypothetical protein
MMQAGARFLFWLGRLTFVVVALWWNARWLFFGAGNTDRWLQPSGLLVHTVDYGQIILTDGHKP